MYTATIEQHRRDYSGTYRNPPATAQFPDPMRAMAWATVWMQDNGGEMRYAVVEGPDFYACSGTDPMPGEWSDVIDNRKEN